ncbi:Two-component signal transduction system YycFG, regulatory protein YycI [Gracilibacillus ureilyticus]|uniref:Two-component signal transduction system YycFG, regulatory protein YycI n=1 Tax=Gracilibacillus ureilyticus TaxID=531814 RepID=A0A1H9UY37_9BACI|nr:two-component system regulatory protein YycI [Gracilibacillus ureilyticus]SES14395.1 Two-component signal transduction system YycFG, regulatory protein YycI [Gracilibacillus ureilyticus]
MQWGQIKTLFILCFLILDIFLLQQFIKNQQTVSVLPEASLEENIQGNIEGLDNIPEEPTEASMLYAQRKELSEDDMTALEELPNQDMLIIEDHLIISRFDDPVAFDIDEAGDNIVENIWNDESYDLENYILDEKTNTYLFFQKIDHPIFYNLSGVLMIHVNEDGDMTSYVQTILEKAEEQPEEKYGLANPMKVISDLFRRNSIQSGSTISKMEFGYHNLLPLPNGVQVLIPTWGVEVNDSEYYYANAVEGHISTRDENEFVSEMRNDIQEYVVSDIGAIQPLDPDWEQQDITQFLNQLLQNIELSDGVN